MKITVNCTYRAASQILNMPRNSLHRILWVDEDRDTVVSMRIDERKLKKPRIWSFTECENLIGDRLVATSVAVIPQHRLDDQQLNDRYPPSPGETSSAPLAYRQKWLAVLDMITPRLEEVWRNEVTLLQLIEIAAATHAASINKTYDVLYRFLAHGSVRLSVVPDWYLCGGKGNKRVGRGLVLGRRKTERRILGLENDNFPLNDDWIVKIRDTYKETVKRGVSGKEGYATFLNLHCISSCATVNGERQIAYLGQNHRPSKQQFLTNGPDGTPEETIWRKQMEPKEFEKNYRGMYGKDSPETFRTGILADVDSTSNDRYLVSVFNRNRGVGTARSLPVVDVQIGYIFGIYVGWRVNSEAAKLAILNAASNKVEYCARYGITISPDEWYSCLHAEYRADKGEFNAETPRESLGTLNRSIEYVISGRPDLRGGGEQTHRRLHDHNADGSTFGSYRKRGEKDPAKAAFQNIFDYERELIRQVLYQNNHAVVQHLLTTEMRQCGVKPIRKEILEWSIKNGYHHQVAYDDADLVLSLCPETPAVVTPNGVYPVVRRHGNSGDEIILDELRYLGPYVQQQRWLERARSKGRWRVTIRMNPNDPNKVWYQDPDLGIQTLHLATQDMLMCRLATVHDLIITKTDEVGTLARAEDEADLALAKINSENRAERKQAKLEKRQLHALEKKSDSKSSSGEGRRKNLQNEVLATGQSPIPIKAALVIPNIGDKPSSNLIPEKALHEDKVSELMNDWLTGKRA